MTTTPGRPSSRGRSGPSPTNVSVPSPRRAKASARRTTFLRSISEPTQTKAGAVPAARASGGKRSRSTPQFTTSTLPPAAGMLRSSSRRSQSETATTAAAPRTTSRSAAGRTGTASGSRRPARARSRRAARARPARRAGHRDRWGRGSARRRRRAGSGGPREPRERRGAACLSFEPPRRSSTTRSSSCPRSASARSRPWTKTPKSGSAADGYICETSRIRTGASSRFRLVAEPAVRVAELNKTFLVPEREAGPARGRARASSGADTARCGPSTGSRSRSSRARWSASSARTAPARRRR